MGVQCPVGAQYENLPCDDGNFRTVGDRCVSGTCTGALGAAHGVWDFLQMGVGASTQWFEIESYFYLLNAVCNI